MHASVVEASELFKEELSRHNYVTPTSYLELLSSYTELINKKKGSLTEGVGRLKAGYHLYVVFINLSSTFLLIISNNFPYELETYLRSSGKS